MVLVSIASFVIKYYSFSFDSKIGYVSTAPHYSNRFRLRIKPTRNIYNYRNKTPNTSTT